MDSLENRVAVITGAASGIGFALSVACAAAKMRVVMVDLPGAKLEQAAEGLRAIGHTPTPRGVDVSDTTAMHAMAKAIRAEFGAVHLLCNNAGIAGVHRRFWKFADAEWQRMLAVNLNGVINGMQAFVPAMIDQDEGHIVNTASMAGLIPTPMNAPYCAAKFAVVGLSEALSLDLQQYGSKIGVSVLCPGLVKTNIGGERSPDALDALDADERQYNDAIAAGLNIGTEPADIARQVLAAVRENRFYILTHPEGMPVIENRLRAIIDGGNPSFPS